ncbi:MAG: acetate--CoA ligase family protein [Candidatus Helarchaeota archaeon]
MMNVSEYLQEFDMFFDPQSIAIYGASNNIQRFGSFHLLNLITQGYEGRIYPIHPAQDTILTVKAYKKIGDVPEKVDLVVMVLPTRLVLEKLEECGQAGVRGIIIVTAGFRELGDLDTELEMTRIGEKYGMKIIGPNCIGIVVPKVRINLSPMAVEPIAGDVSIISQSGSYACHILFMLREKIGLGISKIISVGNEAHLDIVDFLEYLGEDPETKAIGIYVEGIKRGKRFAEVARRVSLKKPIIAIKIGQTTAGMRGAASHTGSIANDERIINGVFKQSGIIQAETSIDMLNALHAFSCLPLPTGPKIGVVTLGGGPGTKIADLLEQQGVQVPLLSKNLQEELMKILPFTASPRNPVDSTFDTQFDNIYKKVPKMLLQSGEVDGIIVYGIWSTDSLKYWMNSAPENLKRHIHNNEMMDLFSRLLEGGAKSLKRLSKKFNKPIIGSTPFSRTIHPLIDYCQDQGLPIFQFEESVRPLVMMVQYAEWLRRQK